MSRIRIASRLAIDIARLLLGRDVALVAGGAEARSWSGLLGG